MEAQQIMAEFDAGVQQSMAEFEAAMVDAGFPEPERNEYDDGYLYESDEDRYTGWLLATSRKTPNAYPGREPAVCPSEIVGALRSECDELRAEAAKLKAIVKSNQRCGCAITPCQHDIEYAARDLDAERYRKLRDEDAWGEDTAKYGGSRWDRLGELHGAAFDAVVDALPSNAELCGGPSGPSERAPS